MWDKGVGIYTKYIRRAEGGPVSLPQEFPQDYQTVTEQLPFLIEQGREAERYGSISPPVSSPMAYAAEGFQGIERALEGNPAQFVVPGSGIAQVFQRKAYGEDPSAMEYGMAALDMADVTPVGKILGTLQPLSAIFVGPAARGARNIKRRVDKLMERGLEGQELWEAQANQSKRGYYDPSDGKFRMEVDTSSASIKPDFLSEQYNDDKFMALDSKIRTEDVRLDQVLDFEELFDQYPQLKGIKVTRFNPFDADLNAAGAYDPVNKTLYMGSQPGKNFLNTMLHEVQHAIQAEERFLRGGNEMLFYRPGFVEESKETRDNLDRLSGDLNEIMSHYSSANKRGFRKPLSKRIPDHVASVRKAYGDDFDKALELQWEIRSPNLQIRNEAYNSLKDLPGYSLDSQVSLRALSDEFESPDMVRRAIKDTGPLFDAYLDVGDEYAELLKEAKEYHRQYRNIPGEVEAVNVETRHQNPDLRAVYPPDTAKVRPEEMIYPLSPAYRREYLRMRDYGPERPNRPIEQKALGGGVGSLSHIARTM